VSWSDYLWFLGVTCLISAVLTTIAVLRIRAICTRETVRRPARRQPRAPAWNVWRQLATTVPWLSPSMDRNPVLSREWHRSRPSRLTKTVTDWLMLYSFVYSLIALALLLIALAASGRWVARVNSHGPLVPRVAREVSREAS
jgi:hypothetical protein